MTMMVMMAFPGATLHMECLSLKVFHDDDNDGDDDSNMIIYDDNNYNTTMLLCTWSVSH